MDFDGPAASAAEEEETEDKGARRVSERQRRRGDSPVGTERAPGVGAGPGGGLYGAIGGCRAERGRRGRRVRPAEWNSSGDDPGGHVQMARSEAMEERRGKGKKKKGGRYSRVYISLWNVGK